MESSVPSLQTDGLLQGFCSGKRLSAADENDIRRELFSNLVK